MVGHLAAAMVLLLALPLSNNMVVNRSTGNSKVAMASNLSTDSRHHTRNREVTVNPHHSRASTVVRLQVRHRVREVMVVVSREGTVHLPHPATRLA